MLFGTIRRAATDCCTFFGSICKNSAQVKLPTMSYTDRLANVGLHSLEYRRVYFRLGKEPNGGSNVKPRLVKVRVANAAQRSVVLRKAKILKESDEFKNVFVRPSHTAAERTHIRGLYDIHGCLRPIQCWTIRPTPRNIETMTSCIMT